jgi:hypothetical protein
LSGISILTVLEPFDHLNSNDPVFGKFNCFPQPDDGLASFADKVNVINNVNV